MATQVRLLGRPAVHHDGTRLEPSRGKTSALLLYLAFQADWCSRDDLLNLLWPDTAEDRARSNLRSLLSRSVKGLRYTDGLEVESSRLRWQVPTDVQTFKKALEEQAWLRAVKGYGGALLEGFWLDNAPEFGEWLEAERRDLHMAWREAVFKLAESLEAEGRHEQAAEALARLCQADALDEEALRRYLRSLHLSGRRDKALATFEGFRQGLERDLDTEPEPETLRILADIEATEGSPIPIKPASQKRKDNLPIAATPFLGRNEEMTQLASLLSRPGCRLVTLVGPGGVGKTRLALALARKQFAALNDGACFVSCVSVAEPEQLVYAVADALSLPLLGPVEPKRQLLEFLRDREMLLVLDNLEQLLPNIGLICDVLEAAQAVKVLATSRERLNFQSEHVFDLFGLPVPEEGASDTVRYDSVRLFAQCAARSRSDFVLDADNLQAVTRICHLVHGLPLAIELATSWLRAVSPADIAQEIEKGIEILKAPRQDAPVRHQSIRAVFDYSWRMLTRTEQTVLKKLAVFQGGFTREAAERTVGASLSVLAGLVNKSFLRTTPEGRYRMHPLVQQYLWEKLAKRPGDAAAVQDAHGSYHTDFLDVRREDLMGGRQLAATREIAVELGNIRAAWHWALKHDQPYHLYRQAPALANFYMYQSRYQEWLGVFNEAAEHLLAREVTEQADLALVFLLTHLGWCNHRLGQFDDAERAARQCEAIYDRLGIPPVPGPATDPVLVLGLVACARDDYTAAARYGEQALHTGEAHGHLHNQSVAHHVLARAALGQQQFAAGEGHAQKSYAIAQQLSDRWHIANCHIELGHAACALSNDAEAQRHYRSSYLICEEFDDKGGMAKALNELGELALRRQAYAEAQDTFRQSLALSEAVREGKALAKALCGLGDAALALGDLGAAPAYYRQALETAAEMRSLPLMLPVVQGVCRLLLLSGHEERAKQLLSKLRLPTELVDRHKGRNEQQTLSNMSKLKASFKESPQRADLATVAATVGAELSAFSNKLLP